MNRLKTMVCLAVLGAATLAAVPTASATCFGSSLVGVGALGEGCNACWGVHVLDSSCVGWNGGYVWCGDDHARYWTCFNLA
jgi:hypothetical protein